MAAWLERLRRLGESRRHHELDAFVISSPVNLRYLTGFVGSSGLLVASAERQCLITDGRYVGLVREAIASGRMAAIDVERVESRYDLTLGAVLERLSARAVGFESEHATVATLARWEAASTQARWKPVAGAVEALRMTKDAEELEILRRGGRALSGVADTLRSWVRAGRTEREVAADIDQAIERAGFERPAFETIVAGGPNSAYPHARPTDRTLQDGDLVVLDFGGVIDGYCVDLTRMAGIGQIGSAARRLYDVVREAQAEALRAVRPGAPGAEVDRAARQVIETHGLAEAFVHGTGHGLGLEVHEGPRLAKASSGAADVLQAGMVCTIEPGVYVEGVGGVRLEDDVIVTIGGSELLTVASRDLLAV